MRKLVLLLTCLLTCQSLAQEMVETCVGLVERYSPGRAQVVLQNLPDRPVAALTLVMPWGRFDDPQLCEALNRVLVRGTAKGSWLTALEAVGGQTSYQSGACWSSFTLAVPRAYASWALSLQLERWSSPCPPGLSPELQAFWNQHWRPSQAVLALCGSFEGATWQNQLKQFKLPADSTSPSPASGPLRPTCFATGRASYFPRPQNARQRAAWEIWQRQLEPLGGLKVWTEPDDQGLWLQGSEVAVQSALNCTSHNVTPPVQQKALTQWLEQWDDLSQRSQKLALEQAQGELGRSLQTYESLLGYDLTQWPQDMQSLNLRGFRQEVEGLALASIAPPKGQKPIPLPARQAPAPPPPFVRLELAPGCGALIQPIPDLPTVNLRALIPGGSALDSLAQAGRAEWLGRCWEKALGECQVETQPFGWQVSAYLPRDRALPWVQRFVGLLGQKSLEIVPAPSSGEVPASLLGYQRWLGLLFPPQHPMGRLGQVHPLAPERVLELQQLVVQRGRWHLFLSGDVVAKELEAALKSRTFASGELGSGNLLEGLPTHSQLPSQPTTLEAPVTQATIWLGGFAPSRRENDYYAFVLLLQALAGDPYSSRLQLELRQKRSLVERLEVNLVSSPHISPWLLKLECRPDKVVEVQAAVRQQLDQLMQQPLSAAELERWVNRLEGQQQMLGLNSSGRVNQLRNLELFRLSDSYNQGFAGLYRGLAPKDLQASAKLRFLPARLATLVMLPKNP